MRRLNKRPKAEPVISLINIVFLILIFFMVAGTLSQPAGDVQFVETEDLECCVDPDALAISADGELTFRGDPIASLDVFLASDAATLARIRLLPDQNLPATELLRIVGELKAAGAENIVVLTEAQRR
ncbi:MAG: biopolymer transporter ExbD [Pseudomonadota bacterium]